MDEVKVHISNLVQQGKQFKTLSADWIIDIPTSSRRKDHIAKSCQFRYMNSAKKKRHNKYILALEKLLANAVYVSSSPNNKMFAKPDIVKYHYFKTKVKLDLKLYEIIFDTEEYTNDKSTKPRVVHLYNVSEKS